ncbi:MAG: hypothetical protein LUG99_09340 [Lachnospiraceae bacterium]|nr:hypothetical protein [Lachnospiraceae bacterium]
MLLLITGCISVSADTPFVRVRKEEERLEQYLATLKWALTSSPFDEIIFCENSCYDYDFEAFCQSLNNKKRFEYLTFEGDRNKTVKFGKGYGEGEIIKYAPNNSKFLKHRPFFYKITGKLIVDNIYDVASNTTENRFMNYCERIDKVDTKFYKVRTEDYIKYLQDAYYEVDDTNNMYLERVIRKYLKENNIKYKSFSCIPIIVGVSGTTGKEYKRPSVRRLGLYNFLCKMGLYNFKFMYPVDWLLNRIHF